MVGPALKTFRALQIEFNISDQEVFTYLQVSHLLRSCQIGDISLPWQVTLYYTSPTAKTRGISLFYLLLNNEDVFTKNSAMLLWEKELGREFTSDQWRKAISVTYSTTKCVNLWELTYKILLQWYMTPSRIAKFAPQASACCWRECGEPGTLYHILWSCPLLSNYWKEVFNLLSVVVGLKVSMEPGLALLSLNVEMLPPSKRIIAVHILLSARLVIARHWKRTHPPPIHEVITTTHSHVTYEALFASSQNSLLAIRPTWQLWFDWYKLYSTN